jgi:putative transposase
MAVLAGIDFFSVEVLTWRGLATYYVLFVLHLETRRVTLAGITRHPTEDWIVQMARRAVDPLDGALPPIRCVLHDRDTKFCAGFRDALRSACVRPLTLPARKSQSEFVCGALGSLCQKRVFIQADSLW